MIANGAGIDVHYVDLDDVDTSASVGVLDADERNRAGRLRRSVDRDRYTCAHMALRLILASYVSADPAALVFDRQCPHCGDLRHGKPRLVPTTLDFNMSHAESVAVVAVTNGQRVGVDVESVWRASAIAESAELIVGDRDDPSYRSTARGLIEVWTAKEAFAKACGLGLRLDLRDIAVYPGGVRHPEVGVSRLFEQTRIGDHVVSVVGLPVESHHSFRHLPGAGAVRWFGRPT